MCLGRHIYLHNLLCYAHKPGLTHLRHSTGPSQVQAITAVQVCESCVKLTLDVSSSPSIHLYDKPTISFQPLIIMGSFTFNLHIVTCLYKEVLILLFNQLSIYNQIGIF